MLSATFVRACGLRAVRHQSCAARKGSALYTIQHSWRGCGLCPTTVDAEVVSCVCVRLGRGRRGPRRRPAPGPRRGPARAAAALVRSIVFPARFGLAFVFASYLAKEPRKTTLQLSCIIYIPNEQGISEFARERSRNIWIRANEHFREKIRGALRARRTLGRTWTVG